MLKNLKAEIGRNNKTITEMAEIMDMSENSFRWKLNEKREFTLNELCKLADLFGVSIDYLAGRKQMPNEQAS